MKTYIAKFGTNNKVFTAIDGNDAKRFCLENFNTTDIVICDEETGDQFPLIDEWLTPTAYIRRCMNSGRYHLYIKYNWGYKGTPDDCHFAPVIEVTKEIIQEDIINEHHECVACCVMANFKRTWFVHLTCKAIHNKSR